MQVEMLPSLKGKQCYVSVISLDRLLLEVNLGVSEEERNNVQKIHLYFKFFFRQLPQACLSDDIADTICYDHIARLATACCQSQSFCLLEHLCYQLAKCIEYYIGTRARLWIKVEKCSPPINNLLGSTSFEYSNLGEDGI